MLYMCYTVFHCISDKNSQTGISEMSFLPLTRFYKSCVIFSACQQAVARVLIGMGHKMDFDNSKFEMLFLFIYASYNC